MTEHTIEEIFKNPSNYKICGNCGRLNVIENENCVGCGIHDLFHKLDCEDIAQLSDDVKKYNLKILFV